MLDHVGNPPLVSGDLAAWREALARLAELPNVACKLSGLFTVAEPGADLFVGSRREDEVPCGLEALTRERGQRHRARGDLSLHVECAATPHLAVAQLAAERIRAPFGCVGQHDVGVRKEEQRGPVAATADACDEVGALGHPRVQLDLRAARLEVLAEQLGRRGLVARRVGRVDADELLEELRDLVADRDRRHQRRVPRMIRYSRPAAI